MFPMYGKTTGTMAKLVSSSTDLAEYDHTQYANFFSQANAPCQFLNSCLPSSPLGYHLLHIGVRSSATAAEFWDRLALVCAFRFRPCRAVGVLRVLTRC